MIKVLIGVGALAVVVIGYFLLVPAGPPPQPVATPEAPAPETAPAVSAPAPEPRAPNEEAVLEEMAASMRESLPEAVSDSLTLNDAVFLPRMRIMEFSYVTSASDVRAEVDALRTVLETRAETICQEGREMFEMGVTLRQSIEDRNGDLFQRLYLLPEDCVQF